MLGLPKSALEALQRATERFPEVEMSGTHMRRFDLPHCRAALAKAKKEGKEGQTPAAIWEPKHGDALVVIRAEDFGALLSMVERRARAAAEEEDADE
jgi:hypothetical protein